jgi:hypothetical protein
MRQSGEVGDEVALGHFGQFDRRLTEVRGGDQVLDRYLGDLSGPEVPRPSARMGKFKDRRLGVASEQRG